MNQDKIVFKPIELSDLDLIYKWVNTDHVLAGYSQEPSSFADVVEGYSPRALDEVGVQGYLIVYDSIPIGFIQSYFLNFESFGSEVAWENNAGLDVFIGEKDYVYKGLGSEIIKTFLVENIFLKMGAKSCIIDPSPTNYKAIRAYEKIGFRYLFTLEQEDTSPQYIMQIDRQNLL